MPKSLAHFVSVILVSCLALSGVEGLASLKPLTPCRMEGEYVKGNINVLLFTRQAISAEPVVSLKREFLISNRSPAIKHLESILLGLALTASPVFGIDSHPSNPYILTTWNDVSPLIVDLSIGLTALYLTLGLFRLEKKQRTGEKTSRSIFPAWAPWPLEVLTQHFFEPKDFEILGRFYERLRIRSFMKSFSVIFAFALKSQYYSLGPDLDNYRSRLNYWEAVHWLFFLASAREILFYGAIHGVLSGSIWLGLNLANAYLIPLQRYNRTRLYRLLRRSNEERLRAILSGRFDMTGVSLSSRIASPTREPTPAVSGAA